MKKKVLSGILASAMVLSMAACGSTPAGNGSTASNNADAGSAAGSSAESSAAVRSRVPSLNRSH